MSLSPSPNALALGNTSFTVEAWVRLVGADIPTETTYTIVSRGDDQLAASFDDPARTSGWSLEYTRAQAGPSTAVLQFEVFEGGAHRSYISRRFALGPDEWRHLAVTYDHMPQALGTATFFIDGINRVTSQMLPPLPLADAPLRIGGRTATPDFHRSWPGDIHQVRLSSTNLYLEGDFVPEARMAPNVSTLALWSFDSCGEAGEVPSSSGDRQLMGALAGEVECREACVDE